ncbi:MAG: hypothetical protein ACK4TA_22225 [Saprospiraceae bacterium]
MKYLVAFFFFYYALLNYGSANELDTVPTPFGIKIDLAPETQKWRDFQSYDGKFSVLVPGEFTENVDSIETAIGMLAYHTFFHQTKESNADNVLYMLSYVDYPAGAIHSDSTELLQEFFTETVDAAVKAVKGELLYANNWKYKNYPGKVWRIDYLDGKAVIKTKAFVAKQRYYVLQAIAKKEYSMNFSADKFLDSFQLIE